MEAKRIHGKSPFANHQNSLEEASTLKREGSPLATINKSTNSFNQNLPVPNWPSNGSTHMNIPIILSASFRDPANIPIPVTIVEADDDIGIESDDDVKGISNQLIPSMSLDTLDTIVNNEDTNIKSGKGLSDEHEEEIESLVAGTRTNNVQSTGGRGDEGIFGGLDDLS
jgi:hypothetical protein